MLTFMVHGENAAASLFLWELTIQCQIAEQNYRRLKEYARVQIAKDYRATQPRPSGPIEVFANCASFLSASGLIAKLIFSGASTKPAQLQRDPKATAAAQRSAALRQLLEVEDLPTLRSLGVRNSFEHIDERLDRLLREDPSGSFIWLHLARDEPPPGLVMKRLNPHTLELSYLDEKLDLHACYSEIALVREQLKPAYNKIRSFQPLLGAAAGVENKG